TLIFLAIIISTQFSFGRFFGALLKAAQGGSLHAFEAFGRWREERRRDKQRREVIAKHTKKGGVPPEIKAPAAAGAAKTEQPLKAPPKQDEHAPAAAPMFGSLRSATGPARPPKVSMPAPV